jgi:hypothetical protein
MRAAPVMDIVIPAGAGIQASVSIARLAPATRQALFARRVLVPNVKGAPFEWSTQSAPGASVRVRLGSQRQDYGAGMLLATADAAGKPQLVIRAVENNLTAEFNVAGASSASVRFGDGELADPAVAAMATQIEIPTGETMLLTFDDGAALQGSRVMLGDARDRGNPPILALGRAEVGQPSATNSLPRLTTVADQLCGSRRGRLLFGRSQPLPGDCRLSADEGRNHLAATELTLEPASIGVAFSGSAFTSSDGRPRVGSLVPKLVGNPGISALMAALVCAIAWPLWRLWAGRGD